MVSRTSFEDNPYSRLTIVAPVRVGRELRVQPAISHNLRSLTVAAADCIRRSPPTLVSAGPIRSIVAWP